MSAVFRFQCEKFRLQDSRYPAQGYYARLIPAITGHNGLPPEMKNEEGVKWVMVEVQTPQGTIKRKRAIKPDPTPIISGTENEAVFIGVPIGQVSLNGMPDGQFAIGKQYKITIEEIAE